MQAIRVRVSGMSCIDRTSQFCAWHGACQRLEDPAVASVQMKGVMRRVRSSIVKRV